MSNEEELQELEEQIGNMLYNDYSWDTIGADMADSYIEVVERIEGQKYSVCGPDVEKRYRYLRELCDYKSRAFLNSTQF